MVDIIIWRGEMEERTVGCYDAGEDFLFGKHFAKLHS